MKRTDKQQRAKMWVDEAGLRERVQRGREGSTTGGPCACVETASHLLDILHQHFVACLHNGVQILEHGRDVCRGMQRQSTPVCYNFGVGMCEFTHSPQFLLYACVGGSVLFFFFFFFFFFFCACLCVCVYLCCLCMLVIAWGYCSSFFART